MALVRTLRMLSTKKPVSSYQDKETNHHLGRKRDKPIIPGGIGSGKCFPS
jgi:hypothetical protein